jgi:GPH family glycoside/pentoside/hexuronide:cation symporter
VDGDRYLLYQIYSEGFTSTFFMIQSAAYIVGTVISEKIIALIGKKKMTLVALLIGIAGVLMQYFIAGDNIWLIMTGVCLYSITLGICFNVVNDCRYRGICRVAPWGAHRRRNLRFL